MKRTIFVLATVLVVSLTVLAVLLVHPVRTVKAHHGCSDSTLMGNYGWTEFGYEPEDSPPDFWTATALVNFNGHGGLSGSGAWSVDNSVFETPTNATFEGTYTVDSDCTVTMNYTIDPYSYVDHGVIVGADGNEIIGIEQGYETTGQIDMKKIMYPD